MFSLIVAAQVTLYCDVTVRHGFDLGFGMSQGESQPSAQRVFTIDPDAGLIYVVAGNREGTVLEAARVTATTIEFPPFQVEDLFPQVPADAEGSGFERINRVSGRYDAQTNVGQHGETISSSTYTGQCEAGEPVPFPTGRF